jgi:transposase-like protein
MEPHVPPSDRRPCPHCASAEVIKHGFKAGRQRYRCRRCGKTFGPTHGTPLYGLHTPAAEIARTLLVLMRRGSLRAAEEVTGHKAETVLKWLLRAAAHAEAITQVLVRELELSEVEVDAFWSFVKKSTATLRTRTPRQRAWARAPERDLAGAA